MRVISKKGILNFSLDVLSMLSLFTATSCIILKSAHTKPICTPEDFDVFAVKTIFSRGSAGLDIFKPFLKTQDVYDQLIRCIGQLNREQQDMQRGVESILNYLQREISRHVS